MHMQGKNKTIMINRVRLFTSTAVCVIYLKFRVLTNKYYIAYLLLEFGPPIIPPIICLICSTASGFSCIIC